jgi:hypothetical protein
VVATPVTYSNVYVCYSLQNVLKALYLSWFRMERRERSKIVAICPPDVLSLFRAGAEHAAWVDVEFVPDTSPYTRILFQDRKRPVRLFAKVAAKFVKRIQRQLMKGSERRRILSLLCDCERVFLFLERSYYSDFILRERTCTLVEEGLSTYKPYPQWSSWRSRNRFPGEEANVDAVLLKYPEQAIGAVRKKADRVEFNYQSLPLGPRKDLVAFFGLRAPTSSGRTAVIVGQAWSCSPANWESVLAFYAKLIDELSASGYAVCFKPHPIENVDDYQVMNCQVLQSKVPIEVFDLLEDVPAFDLAVSILECSIDGVSRIATRRICLIEGDLLVEQCTQELLDNAMPIALAKLKQE